MTKVIGCVELMIENLDVVEFKRFAYCHIWRTDTRVNGALGIRMLPMDERTPAGACENDGCRHWRVAAWPRPIDLPLTTMCSCTPACAQNIQYLPDMERFQSAHFGQIDSPASFNSTSARAMRVPRQPHALTSRTPQGLASSFTSTASFLLFDDYEPLFELTH